MTTVIWNSRCPNITRAYRFDGGQVLGCRMSCDCRKLFLSVAQNFRPASGFQGDLKESLASLGILKRSPMTAQTSKKELLQLLKRVGVSITRE
jgi:hypothetical protein